jgi:hypothetical protein
VKKPSKPFRSLVADSSPESGSYLKNPTESGFRIRDVYPESRVFSTPDLGSKNSNKKEGWKIIFCLLFFVLTQRGQKGTGSRIQIRNTAGFNPDPDGEENDLEGRPASMVILKSRPSYWRPFSASIASSASLLS